MKLERIRVRVALQKNFISGLMNISSSGKRDWFLWNPYPKPHQLSYFSEKKSLDTVDSAADENYFGGA